MSKYFIKSLLFLSCLLINQGAYAVWYQVEMIVFENLYPETDGENWYAEPELVPLERSVVLQPYRQSPDLLTAENDNGEDVEQAQVPYQILPEQKNRLDGVNRVLRLSREYRPLYHVSWQQPGLDVDQARPVHLQAMDQSNLFELTIPAHLVTYPMPLEFYEPVKLVIDGLLQIRSSLYLHVDLDMVLFRTPPEFGASKEVEYSANTSMLSAPKINEPVEYVRLTESRRIKLNELHYFDHPMFGVILQVSRYDE